jgi:hypothetical protein
MDTRVPVSIRELLQAYMRLLETQLPGFVTGLYLYGSIALEAFDENLSDIDFVAFLSRCATPSDLEQLAAIHQTIANHYPRWLLEGTYLQWPELGQLEGQIAPSPIHHDNKFEASGNFDINLVNWWVIKNRGIALIGPQVDELHLLVDWDLLISQMRENLNTYWASYVHKPRRIVWLLTDYGVQWTVLGVLRQYYTFVAHDITSKVGAGDYALSHLPDKWHRIIREAIRIRQQETPSFYTSKVRRAADNYNFLRYIIDSCNSLPT